MSDTLINLPVGIVVVLYQPNTQQLKRLYTLAQVAKGVIVDNSENRAFDSSRVGNMEYMPMHHNCGIAKAQNTGITALLERKDIDYIVFLDQDSDYDYKVVRQLYDAFSEGLKHNSTMAAMGASIIDECSNRASSSLFHRLDYGIDNLCEVREIISSGSILLADALADIGLMDENLFIDFVDFEWCWRAKAKGYTIFRNSQVTLRHTVGRRTFRFCGYEVIISAPERYYYQYRNLLWLSSRSYVPLQWKFATITKYALRFFYVPMLNGVKTYSHILKGIKDGLSSNVSK